MLAHIGGVLAAALPTEAPHPASTHSQGESPDGTLIAVSTAGGLELTFGSSPIRARTRDFRFACSKTWSSSPLGAVDGGRDGRSFVQAVLMV